jgi:hypothetical protein
MNLISPQWQYRKNFWSRWQTLRFSLSKPRTIGPPTSNKTHIKAVPVRSIYPDLAMDKVLMFDALPKEEAGIGMRALVAVGLRLNRWFPQMMPDLPQINPDPHKALAEALSPVYRDAYRAPMRPKVFSDEHLELGTLALESPYAVFLARGGDNLLQWDFRILAQFEHQPGLRSLGLQVFFTEIEKNNIVTLAADRIDSVEYGEVSPDSPDWHPSVLLAICAATTHMALTRHFNYVHLISGNHWDIATRNHLPFDHPLYRLVWPQIFNSLFTNHGVTRVQLLPDGDFVNMFSFTHAGLMHYFDTMYELYDISISDPEADWKNRGLSNSNFESPSHKNLVELFTVMHKHAKRYIDTYYTSDAELQRDTMVRKWMTHLNELIPNGINPALLNNITRDDLARALGAYIYEGIVIHELSGTALWDYQLWSDKNPTRIYTNKNRVPVDVYQRVINNNFALQLERAPLQDNYGQVALDNRGRKLYTQFCIDCRSLQVDYNLARWCTHVDEPWKLEPANLEISMNG